MQRAKRQNFSFKRGSDVDMWFNSLIGKYRPHTASISPTSPKALTRSALLSSARYSEKDLF